MSNISWVFGACKATMVLAVVGGAFAMNGPVVRFSDHGPGLVSYAASFGEPKAESDANRDANRSGAGEPPESFESAIPEVPDLKSWPEPERNSPSKEPLQFDDWAGPYKSKSGETWVEQINAWYAEGSSAGLSQDTFRSFDDGHSSLRLAYYPQLNSEEPVSSLGRAGSNIFAPRVTMGVQSYGIDGISVIEKHSRRIIREFYESRRTDVGFQKFYQSFYEHNFLFVAPAAGSYTDTEDRFSFLSPYYLHSIGASGTDSALLKPLIFASAALPPQIKTRALRTGRYVPTLLYLFKSALADDFLSPDTHRPAYALPEEAGENWTGPTPFLDSLVNSAHDLSHLPPVCRLNTKSMLLVASEDHDYKNRAYFEVTRCGITGTIRKGQEFVIVVDLGPSQTDGDRPIRHYHASLLRGAATIRPLNDNGSLVEVRIPWTMMDRTHDYRTDILLLVNDGTYDSAPAYISIRHIHELDPIVRGIKAD